MIYHSKNIEGFIDATLGAKRMPNNDEFAYCEPDNRVCPENTALIALALTAVKEPQKHAELLSILPARFVHTFHMFKQDTINNIVACVQ